MQANNEILNIYNSDGTPFHDLCLKNYSWDDVTMGLSTKIEGDIFYKNNTLVFYYGEYVIYKNIKYSIRINTPPVIVRKGLTSDNSDLKGMTKYSLTFYHPMYQLYNIPFVDVAVTDDETRYKSEDNTFSWVGTITDYTKKINKCLQNTEWTCALQPGFIDDGTQSPVLQFNNQKISDALKTGYDTWNLPYIISGYTILFGSPASKIYQKNGSEFVFKIGSGLGLTNNDRTPKNNLIITRISGYGSETNIPNGYPKIQWGGDPTWNYTINNDGSLPNSYPIINGIINGVSVKLINHPFTRKHLMPSVYIDLVNKKVNPISSGYNPNIELIDYYDATDTLTYKNIIDYNNPLYYQQEFKDIKPTIVGSTYNGQEIDIIKSISWINDDKTVATSIDDSYNSTTQKYNQGYFVIELYPLGFLVSKYFIQYFSLSSIFSIGISFSIIINIKLIIPYLFIALYK